MGFILSSHVLVEELLQFLVDIVDADLLKGVEVCNSGRYS